MMMTLLIIVAGLVALYFGGELLVRSAVKIGEWCRLSPLVTGLTIVAFGTSAPELAVSVDAALVGSPEIAIANVVGSNFANMALVLALSALIVPIMIEPTVLQRDLLAMLGSFVLVILLMLDQQLSQLDGLILVVALAVYLVLVVKQSRRAQLSAAEAELVEELPEVHMSVWLTLLSLAGGVLLLALGGHFLVKGAVVLAASLGLSEAIIGMTVVAVGTSLPEITASIIAVLRGHGSMAVGNVVGSNIWNTFGVLGVTSTLIPLEQGGVSNAMVLAMAACGVLLWVLCRTGHKLTRIEGGMLLLGYFGCQAWFIVAA